MRQINIDIIGEKAKGLITLSDIFKGAVPEFLIVRFEELFKDYQEKLALVKDLANDYLSGDISDSKYKELIENTVGSMKVRKNFLEQLKKELKAKKFTKVSYRTSAANEDLIDHSFAGQYLTILDADTNERTLIDAAFSCFKSLFSLRVLNYTKQKKIHFDQDGSLIIQKMFYGKASGVLFTENGCNEIEISYALFWKNVVVEGENSFNLKIPKINLTSFRLPNNLPKTFSQVLNASQLIETKLGQPVDIEWSVSESDFALLQVRPITKINLNYVIEWDNTNIAESYPEITLPLTYSFIRRNYARVYPEFLKLLGRKENELEAKRDIFENMLGYIHGRVYYNINNWYELVKLVPGYKYNKGFFEAMLLPAKSKPSEVAASPRSMKDKILFIVDLIKFAILLLRTDGLSSDFTKEYFKKYKLYKSIKWGYINSKDTLRLFENIERDLLRAWAVPILNDFRTMVFHGLLKKLYFPEKNDQRYLDFLSGIYDQTSIEPLRELATLAKKVQGIARKIKNENQLIEDISSGLYPDIRDAINEYLVRFGGRSPDELKLENPRLEEDVNSFIGLVVSSAAEFNQIGQTKRKNVFKEGGFKKLDQSILKKILFPFILEGTKKGISKRERFRFYRAQSFNLARQAYLAIGSKFEEVKILENKEDIFWLTHEEIHAFILGHSIDKDAKDIVQKRKKLFQSYKENGVGRRAISTGLVAASSAATDPIVTNQVKNRDSHRIFTGLGVSPGVFEGKAVVVKEFDPKANVAGKILIASHTDPGWTLLFLNAKAIVVERGNALSHASIVSRELGIPAVVGLEGICEIIKNNDRVVVNGSTGELTIL